jgi:hypothetical protein
VDWGSFSTGVAATVVGGLIVAAVIAGARWYGRRREKKKKEAEAEYSRRRPIRVGGHIVAKELRANAEVLVKRSEEGDARGSVSLFEWRSRKNEMAGLRDENPELWHELETAYAELDITRHGVVKPPRSDDLLRLC